MVDPLAPGLPCVLELFPERKEPEPQHARTGRPREVSFQQLLFLTLCGVLGTEMPKSSALSSRSS